jgi:AcrR family transcriptional regulator
MTSTTPGLRERKKQRTKQDLQRVALELFVERGFDEVTTDDIAAAADVSKTTFYRYFESKEDVLLGTAAEKLALMRAALAARPDDEPPLDAVRAALLEVAGLYEIDREQKLLINHITSTTPSLVARNLEHQAAWEELLRDYFADRAASTDPSLPAFVLAASVVATVRASVEYWLTHGAESPLPELVDRALALLVSDLPRTDLARTDPLRAKERP